MKNCWERFQPIRDNPLSTVPYYSESEFSMHQLLEHLLEVTGPARVRISSFSLSEIALRSFVRMMESGSITFMTCLLDLTVKRHRLGLLFFATRIIPGLGLAKNHAKLILLENQDWQLLVLSSANLNVNDKIEAGLVTGDPALFGFFSDRFDHSYETSLKVTADEFK